MIEHVRYRVTGRVQGVFFRACTQDAARAEGITGWVRNHSDGSVIGEACGETGALDRFIAWLHEGSPHSRVDRVELKEREETDEGPGSFEVRY